MVIKKRYLCQDLRKDLRHNFYNIIPFTWLLHSKKIYAASITQIGGGEKIHEIIFNNIKYLFRTRYYQSDIDSDKRLQYSFVTIDGTGQCATLIRDGDTALLQSLSNDNACVLKEDGDSFSPLKEKVGTILMYIIIEYCKYKGIRVLTASDNAHMHSDRENTFVLKYSHTLLYGKPWYYKFGFKFIDPIEDTNVNFNYDLYMKLTCKDIPKKYIKYEINPDAKIGEYFRMLIQKDINFFHEIYEDVYNDLGFKRIRSRFNEMKLILSHEIKTFKKIS